MVPYLEALTKIPLYGGLLLFVGAAVRLWLLPAAKVPSHLVSSGVVRVALRSSAVVCVFLMVRLVVHTLTLFEDERLSLHGLSVVAWQSRWGHGWRLQTLAAMFAVATSLAAWNWRRTARVLLTTGAILLAASYPQLGHAAGSVPRESIVAAHLLGGGAWVGTLTVLVLLDAPGPSWARFSNVALLGASVVLLSGLLLASSYLTSWRDLYGTGYGRLFMLKMTLFAGIVACGAANWRNVRLDAPPPMARVEARLALLLVIVTAFLTEMAHP